MKDAFLGEYLLCFRQVSLAKVFWGAAVLAPFHPHPGAPV